ncbi:hypothetical protein VM1G_04532 [Cytospora mali]|uniref:PH domain-containing protein n=1 Tax=Cytospora mali TaxID=578113 RepID=A0A194VX72_CYTMA|nr:hypothetical protein VM1G_04532 [Valsa mali]
MRPPDLEIKATMENRIPLRDEKDGKPVKRESRLGFRSIFARRRGISEDDNASTVRTGSRSGMRDSLTTDVNALYGLQWPAVQSEMHFSPIKFDGPSTRPRTSTLRSPTFAPPKSPLGPSHKKRGSLATWDPIPLFQAHPQAIRIATLPACLQADSLLRLHHRRETLANTAINHPDLGDQKSMFVDMARKKHRRNSSNVNLEWTTKLYALVTSGYLLQYSGEGTHDRLPEKVVQLCKDSAAFASDVIPGRHWVLQVSSIFEEGAPVTQDTRSLFGKFGMREKERRQASDILMVFESAEDMEDWMTLLRREIESLGGKRSLTETGAPKECAKDFDLNAQPSPRTLVVRDRHQFAPTATSPNASAIFDGSDLHLDATLTDLLPERSFDDNSTTASIISQDGRQLDGLRDSSNRYSFMSAARTIVTSDSSPSNSPIRNSFGSQFSDPDDVTPLADDKTLVEVRRRPNAAEIDDRRKSYRTSNIFLDTSAVNAAQPSHRGHLSLSSIQEPPNFSLPQPGGRRRTVTSGEHVHIAHTTSARPPRRLRRPPPSSLGLSRPLSIVADSPSPSKSPLETDDSADLHRPLDSPSMCTSWLADGPKPEYDISRTSSRTQMPMSTRPRKYASTNSLRPADSPWEGTPQPKLPVRGAVCGPSPTRRASEVGLEVPRSTPSIQPCTATNRSRSPIIRAVAAQRRPSACSMQSPKASPRLRSVSEFANSSAHRAHRATRSDQHDEVTRSRTRSPPPQRGPRRNTVIGHNRTPSGSSEQSVLDNLCSLPQIPQALAHTSPVVPSAGPPLAPPPNKALPPIPQTYKRRSESNPPRMRMRSASALGGGI